jgi:hypothetical protein
MLWVVHEMRSEHGRSAIRFLKVDPASRAVLQETIIADEQLDLFYASIAVNEFEQVVIGFSGSGESQYASAYAVVGETVEGVTEFSDPILLKEGVAGYEFIFSGRNRWGDYSATVVDPAASHVFWTFQEFVQGENSWGTQVTEIRLPLRLVEVEIDVKPGNEQNPLNPNGQGVVPVLMLGSEAFDVADVDVTTLAFGPSGGTLAHPKGPHVLDRTHDGNTDMLAHFRVNEAGVASGDGEQCVTGELLDGTPFRGCDTVRTVPPE